MICNYLEMAHRMFSKLDGRLHKYHLFFDYLVGMTRIHKEVLHYHYDLLRIGIRIQKDIFYLVYNTMCNFLLIIQSKYGKNSDTLNLKQKITVASFFISLVETINTHTSIVKKFPLQLDWAWSTTIRLSIWTWQARQITFLTHWI